MINICVLSSDKHFASMLCSELGEIKENISVTVNQYSKGSMVVLDLDSDVWSAGIDTEDPIIGFSRNEGAVSKSILNKCYSVMHRPFLIEDLINTVKNLLLKRDSYRVQLEASDVFAGGVEPSQKERLRFDRDSVYLDDKRIGLSGNEYAVLKLLYDNLTMPVSRGEICRVLSSSDGNMCDVYICHLRSKLEKNRSEKFIFTVRGKGYMLKI